MVQLNSKTPQDQLGLRFVSITVSVGGAHVQSSSSTKVAMALLIAGQRKNDMTVANCQLPCTPLTEP
jgi:hypothetical protein